MKKFTSFLVFAFLAIVISGNTAFGQISQVTGSPQTGTTTNTTLTINRPSGLAVGDVMIANIVQSDNDGNNGGDLSNATLSGWTLIAGNQTGIAGSGGDEWWGTLLYKVATASDVAAADFSFSLDGDADDGSGAIMAFRNVDLTGGVTVSGAAGGPFDVDPGSAYVNVANDNSLNADAITTVTSNAAVIMFGVVGDNQAVSAFSTTNPGSLSLIYSLPYNADLDMGSGAAWALKPVVGSTGGGTATIGGNAWNGAIMIALKPAPASATLSPSGTQNVAVGGTINFTATANNYGGSGNYTYTWTAVGATIPGSNPNNIAASSDSKTLTFPSAGTYTVSVSIARTGESTHVTNTTTVNVLSDPGANLWATSTNGNMVSSFNVSNGVYFSGPTNLFDPFPSTTETTAALGRNDKPSQALGYFYWLPNNGTNGVVNVYAADNTGGSRTLIGTLDVNGASTNNLGFVRLGMGPDGTGWILAGDGTTLYLAKFTSNGVNPVTITVEDASVSLVNGTVATFQNGDLCISGTGNIYALANDGSGVTQIYTGFPNGSSTTLTKKLDLVDGSGNPFTGTVNGVAFDLLGSLYISTGDGLYYINQATVNGPAGTVSCILVHSVTGLQDLASNFFPSQSTLPVKLQSFTVTKQGSNAVLNWTTQSEINSDHFEIERSTDGINFSVVGTKQAAGNSVSGISYQFTDPISISSGILYYRLKTVDIDAKADYSKIVPLRLNGAFIKNFTVFPNPFSSDVKVQINSEKDMMATIRINNASGQAMVSKKAQLQRGDNVIVLAGELKTLQAGMYILEIITDEGKMTQKIIKR